MELPPSVQGLAGPINGTSLGYSLSSLNSISHNRTSAAFPPNVALDLSGGNSPSPIFVDISTPTLHPHPGLTSQLPCWNRNDVPRPGRCSLVGGMLSLSSMSRTRKLITQIAQVCQELRDIVQDRSIKTTQLTTQSQPSNDHKDKEPRSNTYEKGEEDCTRLKDSKTCDHYEG